KGTPFVGGTRPYLAGPGGNLGTFMAWDAAGGRKVWENKEPYPNWSGALVTAGDVAFYGTLDGWFKSVDARTGKVLSKFKVGSGVVGNPITYRGPDGRQYVAVYAGFGGDWALLSAIRYEAHIAAGGIAPPGAALRNPHQGDPAVAKKGALLFTAMNCDGCHGGEGSGWVGPNLADGRWRYGGADAEVFDSIYY